MKKNHVWKSLAIASFGCVLLGSNIHLASSVQAADSSFHQEVQALETQAQSYSQQGQSSQAQQTYSEAATLVRETAQDIFQDIIPVIGDEHPALGYAQQSLELAEKSGDRLQIAMSLNLIGEIQFASGGTSNARTNYEKAISQFSAGGHNGGFSNNIPAVLAPEEQIAIAYSNVNLGKVEQSLVKFTQAGSFYQQALQTFQSLSHTEGEIVVLQNMADLARQQRDFPEAIKNYRQALQLARQTQNQAAATDILLATGDLRKRQRQNLKAKQSYKEALEAAGNLPNLSRQKGKILNRLGSLELQAGQSQAAVELYTEALSLAQKREILQNKGQFSAI